MRVSPATLRRHLAKATSALRAALPANPPSATRTTTDIVRHQPAPTARHTA